MHREKRLLHFLYLTLLSLFILGTYIRLFNLPTFMDGRLTGDENYIGRLYVFEIISGVKTLGSGASQLVFGLGQAAWYSLFSFTPLTARFPGILLSAIGLLFWFLFVKKYHGCKAGLVASAIFWSSIQSSYWPKLVLDAAWALALFPIFLFCATKLFERPGLITGLLVGIAACLCSLTYSTFLFSFLILGLAFAATNYSQILNCFRQARFVKFGIGCFAGFLIILMPVLQIHKFYGGSSPLFFQGGRPTFDLQTLKTNLLLVTKELFFGNDTWYNLHPSVPTLPWPLAFLVLGVLVFALFDVRFRSARPWILCFFLLVIAVPFTGAYPGLRRVLPIHYVISVIIAIGFGTLLEAKKPFRDFQIAVATMLLLMVTVTGALYWDGHGRELENFTVGTGMLLPYRSDLFIQIALQENDVCILSSEAPAGAEKVWWTSLPLIYKRFNPEVGLLHQIKLINNLSELPRLAPCTIMTSNKSLVNDMIKTHNSKILSTEGGPAQKLFLVSYVRN